MYAQLAAITTSAFVASLIHGDTSIYGANTCQKPDFGKWADCNGTGAGYYYDPNKTHCILLTDTGCPNQTLFRTRKNCTDVCHSDEGPKQCAQGPTNPCSANERGKRRYYYNITAQACSSYNRCGKNTHPSPGENSFYTNASCENYCGGFTVQNINGEAQTSR